MIAAIGMDKSHASQRMRNDIRPIRPWQSNAPNTLEPRTFEISLLPPRLTRHLQQRTQHELDRLPLAGLDLHRRGHAGRRIHDLAVHVQRRAIEGDAGGIGRARCAGAPSSRPSPTRGEGDFLRLFEGNARGRDDAARDGAPVNGNVFSLITASIPSTFSVVRSRAMLEKQEGLAALAPSPLPSPDSGEGDSCDRRARDLAGDSGSAAC